MISIRQNLKEQALTMRRNGASLNQVKRKLGIPKSTLSGWFKNVEISKVNRNKLRKNWLRSLMKARTKAVLWHNKQKEHRLTEAWTAAQSTLNSVDRSNISNIELALSLLYLGEGCKKTPDTSIGNTDPLILKFFLVVLIKIYKLDINKIAICLHLRADQNSDELKRYWAKELGVPLRNFRKTLIDKRTIGIPSYPGYKGVCMIRCGTIAIQRKLIYLSREYCKSVIDLLGG